MFLQRLFKSGILFLRIYFMMINENDEKDSP